MQFPNIASLLKTATTNVNIANASAPTTGQVLTATSSTAATWQTPTWGETESTIKAKLWITTLSWTNTWDQDLSWLALKSTTITINWDTQDLDWDLDFTNVWYLNIPQNSQSANYTTVLADSGKHIYHPSADTTARTITIDSNANVPYPIGTAITFVNDTSAWVMTIAITSDTLVLAWAWTTWSRTLAANWVATAIKITSTRWQINWTWLT